MHDFRTDLRNNFDRLTLEQKRQALALIEERERLDKIRAAQDSFFPFVRAVWPEAQLGHHHKRMADAFDRVACGECKRLIINMAPRHTKSEFTSWLLPSWFLGRFPKKKIIQCSNTADLAEGFGRRVRNMLNAETSERDEDTGNSRYHEIFPGITLATDSKAQGHWHTNKGGEYFAIGVNGKVTGKGGDIIIIDDPHSEQEAKQAETNPDIFDSVYDWYTSGPRQRLQPGGAIIIVMTRWGKRDLTGQVVKRMQENEKDPTADKWEVIELPALLDENTEDERPMWPGFWTLDELRATRAAIPVSKWQAQYQQKPTSEEGAILKRDMWKIWGSDTLSCPGPQHVSVWLRGAPPVCKFMIQSWDTAIKKTERADFSACTTWGVFEAEDPTTGKVVDNVILLSAYKSRLSFPELKKKVKQFYLEDNPDILLIEDKGSGSSLLQELHAMNVPAEGSAASRGKRGVSNDKVARANMVTSIFSSGYVWRPDRRWAEEVSEECAEFPNGEHDDYVDTVVQAMRRFRDGMFLRTADDDDEDDDVDTFDRGRPY